MKELSRRLFLGGVGAGALTAFLGGCAGGNATPGASGSAGASGGGVAGADIRWWDHFGGLQDLHKRWAAEQSAKLGVGVAWSYNEPGKALEALQLANQTKQLPDIYSNTAGLPLPALVAAGWLHPIEFSKEAMDRLPKGTFVEGISMLDGVVYGLPAMSDRQYWAVTWYNSEIADKVGFDPPKSYDDLLAACKAIADDGTYAPMTLALGASGRMRDQMDDLAQAAGFPGWQGRRFDTGEYNYADDAYLNGIELLKEISDKGWLLPGSNGFQVPDARGRWAAGNVGFIIDGPWSPGGVRALNKDFVPKMAQAGEITPDGEDLIITRGAPEPTWFIAGNSGNPEAATQVVESFTQDDYQAALAAAMDQPPLNLEVVAKADVIKPYADLIADFQKRVFRAPQPQVRNVDVSKVLALTTPIAPTMGDLLQGYLGGNVSDLKGELAKLSDNFSEDLDAAIEKAKADGANVSRTDFEFSDWTRGKDYTY